MIEQPISCHVTALVHTQHNEEIAVGCISEINCERIPRLLAENSTNAENLTENVIVSLILFFTLILWVSRRSDTLSSRREKKILLC